MLIKSVVPKVLWWAEFEHASSATDCVDDSWIHLSAFQSRNYFLQPKVLRPVLNLQDSIAVTILRGRVNGLVPIVTYIKESLRLLPYRTGCGKTLAFVLPIIEKLNEKGPSRAHGRPVSAIVLAPTRELAKQVNHDHKYEILRSFQTCKFTSFCIGWESQATFIIVEILWFVKRNPQNVSCIYKMASWINIYCHKELLHRAAYMSLPLPCKLMLLNTCYTRDFAAVSFTLPIDWGFSCRCMQTLCLLGQYLDLQQSVCMEEALMALKRVLWGGGRILLWAHQAEWKIWLKRVPSN